MREDSQTGLLGRASRHEFRVSRWSADTAGRLAIELFKDQWHAHFQGMRAASQIVQWNCLASSLKYFAQLVIVAFARSGLDLSSSAASS
jgi:hypothetical protein